MTTGRTPIRQFYRWRDKGCMEESAGDTARRSRLCVADDRCQLYQDAFPHRRCSRRESGHGLHKKVGGGQQQDTFGSECAYVNPNAGGHGRSHSRCSQASILIEGIDTQYLLADKGYNTGVIIAQTGSRRETCAPATKNPQASAITTSICINCVIG